MVQKVFILKVEKIFRNDSRENFTIKVLRDKW